MKITFLGGAGEVGRSGVLFETGDKRFIVDYGIKVNDRAPAELPLVPQKKVHEAVISHAHLDHIGFLPMIYERENVPWHATPPTYALAELLIEDAMKVQRLNGFENPFTEDSFERAMGRFSPVRYNEPVKMRCGGELTMHDAGHILGASMCDINIENRRVLYTGDFNLKETRMHKGAKFEEDVDIIITESTYAMKEHPDRKNEEKRLAKNIEWAIERGGSALVPTFAVGRGQELLTIIYDHFPDVDIYLDGMARKATDIYLRYPDYIKDAKELHTAMHNAIIVKRPGQRRKAMRGGSIIISPAGMLSGGNALWYLNHLPMNSSVTITGFCAEGTNGWWLLNKGYIIQEGKEKRFNIKLDKVDLSAHAGREDLVKFIRRVNPELVVAMHGDDCFRFADELRDSGLNAIAPSMGQTIPV